MLSRATERRPSVPRPPTEPAKAEAKTVSAEKLKDIAHPAPAFGVGVTAMMGETIFAQAEGGPEGSPNPARVRSRSGGFEAADTIVDSAHKMAAPVVMKPTGWAPMGYQQAPLSGSIDLAMDQKTSPNLNCLRDAIGATTGATSDSSALSILAEQLREERKRNERLANELETARKAAHQAELALARCEAKLDLKEEAIEKLEKRLAAA